jgi:hypothetical protein
MSELNESKPKTIKVPGPDHPITIERNPNRVVISVAGRVIADTRDALTLRESTYRRSSTFLGETSTWHYSSGRVAGPTAPTKATAHILAFRWAGNARSIPCGRTSIHTRPWAPLRTISPFTPIASTRSKNDAARRRGPRRSALGTAAAGAGGLAAASAFRSGRGGLVRQPDEPPRAPTAKNPASLTDPGPQSAAIADTRTGGLGLLAFTKIYRE